MPLLLIALIVVPLAEIAVFIQVGGLIGLAPTLVAVVATAVLGAMLLRRQGLHIVQEAQAKLNRHEAPIRELFDGLCLFAAGAFLLTPGFLTDAVGFLLLVPAIRLRVAWFLWRRITNHGGRGGHDRGFSGGQAGADQTGRGHGGSGRTGREGSDMGGREGPVIDADFEEVQPGAPTSGKDDNGVLDTDPPTGSRWGRSSRGRSSGNRADGN